MTIEEIRTYTQCYTINVGDTFRDDVSGKDLIIVTKINDGFIFSTFYDWTGEQKSLGVHTKEDFKNKILPLFHPIFGEDKIPHCRL